MSLFDIQKFKSKITKILREFKYKLISLVQLSKFAKSHLYQGSQRFNRVTPLEVRILRLIAQMTNNSVGNFFDLPAVKI